MMFGFLFFVSRKSLYTVWALCGGFINSSQMSQQVISPTYWAMSSADAPAYDPISRAVQVLSILKWSSRSFRPCSLLMAGIWAL